MLFGKIRRERVLHYLFSEVSILIQKYTHTAFFFVATDSEVPTSLVENSHSVLKNGEIY